MSLHRSVKHGIGRLTASADRNVTRLTQISHKAPTRLVPLGKSSVAQAGAAICALSNYGGGMLQGDSCELHVQVNAHARLGVTTQGASRIYTQRTPNVCQATLECQVEQGGLLVWAPDPCSLYRSSSFQQVQKFHIHPDSSVVLIDWFSSGRYRNGEHWAFDQLTTRTSLSFLGEDVPFLQDAVHMDLNIGQQTEDPLGVSQFHAFASLIVYGEETTLIQQECQALQDALAAQHTRIRERDGIVNDVDVSDMGLAGRVCMGMSRVPLKEEKEDAYVVRFAATTNEDLYRIFHHCLLPIRPQFGLEFYKDRIRAKASEIPRVNRHSIESIHRPAKKSSQVSEKETISPHVDTTAESSSDAAMWSAYMLADSALPTGSFAHSAGLETADQLGMLQNEDDVRIFVQASTRSAMQMTTPFLMAGHRLTMESNDNLLEQWQLLDQKSQAVLAPNGPACAASLDQGKSLARVAQQWFQDNRDPRIVPMLECFQQASHIGPVLGAVAALLGLTPDQVGKLFGYCVARDMISAGVRLSLVGPLASVKLLHRVQASAEDGWKASMKLMNEHEQDPMAVAAASAPVIESLHPCHELLQVRLFRT